MLQFVHSGLSHIFNDSLSSSHIQTLTTIFTITYCMSTHVGLYPTLDYTHIFFSYTYVAVLCISCSFNCVFFFSIRVQFCRNLVLTKSDNVDWKLMYFTLQKHYPMKEQYGDTLHFCKHCSILFWKVNKHTCNHKHVMQETPYEKAVLFIGSKL